MTEEKEVDITEKEETDDKSIDLIDKTNEATERRERANQKTEELIKRQERLTVETALSGDTEAGKTEEKKEETPEEYKNRIMAGEA